MDENEKGYYSAVEKEILILVESIAGIIERTKMNDISKAMAASIQAQLYADQESVRKHAAIRNKTKYVPLPETSALVGAEKDDVTDDEIENIYERMEAVYFSMIKLEQSIK